MIRAEANEKRDMHGAPIKGFVAKRFNYMRKIRLEKCCVIHTFPDRFCGYAGGTKIISQTLTRFAMISRVVDKAAGVLKRMDNSLVLI